MSTQGGVFFLPDIFPGEVCLSSFSLFYVFNIIRVTGAVRVVGNNRTDDAAYNQCAEPVPAVHAAVIAMMVMTRRRCGVMLDDGTATMDNGAAVMDGSAPVHHGCRPVVRAATMNNGTAVMDGSAPVHHGCRPVIRAATVHNGTVVMYGAAFVHHGLCLVARTGLVHGLHSLGRCFMNSRSCLMTGTLSLHRGFHLMAVRASRCFPPDLLGLHRGSAAAIMMG